jgi:hypothetical protein
MRSLRGRPIGKGLAILLAVIGFTGPLGATPFIPEHDADVLERLPTTLGSGSSEMRGLRDQLARAPTDPALAVSVAGRYVEMGQVQTDPRILRLRPGRPEPLVGACGPTPGGVAPAGRDSPEPT